MNLLRTATLFLVFTSFGLSADAQVSTISPTGTTAVAPTTLGRSTENLSVTNGSRTSLSVGNATSFGASANLSASEGLTAVSRSYLAPYSVGITSNIGAGAGGVGLTKINISNLTAKGGGTIVPGSQGGIGSGTTINANDGQFASGDATIDGMGANVDMQIKSVKPNDTDTGSEASFFAIVHPNIRSTAENVNAGCNPTNTSACSYTDQNKLVSGNAGASANLSTQTNIDIQANSFTQTFAQSF